MLLNFGNYGVPKQIDVPFPISEGDAVIRFVDASNANCFIDLTVPAPPVCSEDCQITAVFDDVLCDDNGTPLDPSDDTYTFSLLVTNGNFAGQWEAEIGGLTITGSYGTPVTVGPYNIADGDVTVENIRDVTSPACTLSASLAVPAPATCSGGLIVDCPLSTHYCPILDDNIMLFLTGPFDCSADVEAPLPDVTTSCAGGNYEVITEVVQYVNGTAVVIQTILPGEPRLITGVGIGDYVFRYTVTDDCGNTVVKECIFRVAELQPMCYDGHLAEQGCLLRPWRTAAAWVWNGGIGKRDTYAFPEPAQPIPQGYDDPILVARGRAGGYHSDGYYRKGRETLQWFL